MDKIKLVSSKEEFENYIASIELDRIDKAWLISWKAYESNNMINDTILSLQRHAHYNGFLQGSLAVAEGRLK